jgi:molybdopterin-guanine dinucleotide biosynthesis protein A
MIRNSTPVSAAVLAGGQSRRMGADKALLPLVDGGAPLLAIVVERLSSLADDVFIVAGDRERYAGFGATVVPDLRPGGGALSGIHAAVSRATYEHCLVVACDMPFLSSPLLTWMISKPRDYDVLIPMLPGESRQGGKGMVYQTLHAIYSKGCLPAIESRIERGQFQVIGFFAEVRVRPIHVEGIKNHDPELRSFFNANTPEALATARRLDAPREPEPRT